MTLTQEQMKQLSPFERHFNSAINGDWAPYPGKTNLEMMDAIWREVSGIKIHTDISCRVCVLDLLKDLGRLYFEVAAERAKEKEQNQLTANKKTATEMPAEQKSKGQRTRQSHKQK